MNIDTEGKIQEDVISLRDLNEGDTFRFVYETKVRQLSQKGKIEGYCPIVGDYGSSISGMEVYHLGAKVIKIDQP